MNIGALEQKAPYSIMMIIFDITFQNRSSAVDPEPQVKLEDILPLAFTRLCEPKEASYSLIRKYVSQYYPKLRVDIRYETLAWTLKHRSLCCSCSPLFHEKGERLNIQERLLLAGLRIKTFLLDCIFLFHCVFLFISPCIVSF